ncbi:MAG: imidazolonepropionase [Polyangiaceae bacterium]|nr:imidazolonepropionase [Polyangiaceae bacterium]
MTAGAEAECVDLLVVGAAEVLTCGGTDAGPARGPAQADVGAVRDGAVAIHGGQIVEVGARARLERAYGRHARRIVDARGGVVLPGFVDAHTHLVFAGDRAAEWEARMAGVPYLELLARGGGIRSTVRATRAASLETLLLHARRWLSRAVEHGTTTLEAKSGYGLERATELRLLRVIEALRTEVPIELVSTFLGAHVVPDEHRERRDGYLELLEELHVEIARTGLAEYVDVFCEQEAFTVDEAERLLRHAAGLGFGLKLHAEQFTASGAAALGARLGAVSIDHLEHASEASCRALGAAARPPVAVLLPGVAFHLGEERHAPGRALVDAGVPVAIATDFNPGSSFTPSIPACIALGARTLGLSVAECIVAATRNAAHAVGRGADRGSLVRGRRADVLVCDVPDHRWLGYSFGWNPVRTVIAGGRVVRDRASAGDTRPAPG